MEDSDKGLESTDGSNATGRIGLQYTGPNGRTQRWNLVQFLNFSSQYDARNRIWMSEGDAISDTRPQQRFHMKLTCDVRNRVLAISLQNSVFTIPGTHMHATVFNAGRTLEIGFLKDAEGHTDTPGDQYLIRGNSRLKLSL